MRSILVPIICFFIILATVMAQATEKECSQIFPAGKQESSHITSSTAQELEKQDIDLPESMDRMGWRAAYARLVKHQWPMNEFAAKEQAPDSKKLIENESLSSQESATSQRINKSKAIPARVLKAELDKYKKTSERRSQESIARRVFLSEQSEKISALLARLDSVFPEIFSTYHQQLMKSRGEAERVPSRYRPYAQLKSKHRDIFDSIIAPLESAKSMQELQVLFQNSENKITVLLNSMATSFPQESTKAYQGLVKIQSQVQQHNLQVIKMIGRRALVREYISQFEPEHLKHLPSSESDIDNFYSTVQSRQVFLSQIVEQLLQASSLSMADRMIDEGLMKIREAANPMSSIHNLTLKEALDKIVKEDFFHEVPNAEFTQIENIQQKLLVLASKSQQHHNYLWSLLNLQRRANLRGIPWNGQHLSLLQQSENEQRLSLKEFFLREM
jgi:hypothetical protein